MSDTRVIKKYANRRLYDTEESRYVNLSEIRELVLADADFAVVDVSTGEDITRQILLQVISEQELGDQPMFTKELLTQMIQFYGGAFQSMFTDYLAKAAEMLNGQQKAYQEQWHDMFKSTPMTPMNEFAQQNFKTWTDMQQQMLKMYGLAPPDKDKQSD